ERRGAGLASQSRDAGAIDEPALLVAKEDDARGAGRDDVVPAVAIVVEDRDRPVPAERADAGLLADVAEVKTERAAGLVAVEDATALPLGEEEIGAAVAVVVEDRHASPEDRQVGLHGVPHPDQVRDLEEARLSVGKPRQRGG